MLLLSTSGIDQTDALKWPMLQLQSHLPADPFKVSLDLPCASQCRLNMRQHILSSHMLQKVRARDKSGRLISRAAQQKRLACFMQAIGELLKSWMPVASSAVILRRRRITTSPNTVRSLVASASFSVVPKRNGPWIRRMVTFEGMSLSCRMCACPSSQVLARDWLDGRRLRDAVDIEERRKRHADPHRYSQVREDRQSKRRKPDGNVGLRQTKDGADLPPLPHVVGHHEQHRSQSCQRHKAGQRRRDQKNCKQRERMDHSRYRRERARADVGRCAGNRTRSPGCHQRAETQYSQRPARPVPGSSCDDLRSSRRQPPPRAGFPPPQATQP